jgi:hypothetical protein
MGMVDGWMDENVMDVMENEKEFENGGDGRRKMYIGGDAFRCLEQ